MIPYSYNMVDMGGIDLVEANGTVVEGLYNRLALARNACGDLILYNWKFVGIEIAPSACSTIDEGTSIIINGFIEVTDEDIVNISLGPDPPVPPVPSVVLSGTQVPTTELGEDEQLYVQYYEAVDSNFEYGITAIFRRVSGEWVLYTDPTDLYFAVHIWTKSVGGYDASMYVQYGRFIDGSFVPTGEVESVLYSTVTTPATAKDCEIVNLYYSPTWTITAKRSVVLNGVSYSEGQVVASWAYSTSVDYIITKGE